MSTPTIETTTTNVLGAIQVAQQYATLAASVAAPFLSVKQNAAATLASAALGLVLQSIQQQTDIADVDMATLDAQEVMILAADAKAQADAEIRSGGG